MAASSNATRVFWGTAWTSRTLLARELRAAREAELADGIRRVFVLNADEVAQEVQAYGDYVRTQVARLGRSHPMVRTQFYSEEIDAESGMFPAQRRALMQGEHAFVEAPEEGKMYAFLLDVGGEEEEIFTTYTPGVRRPLPAPSGTRSGFRGAEGRGGEAAKSTQEKQEEGEKREQGKGEEELTAKNAKFAKEEQEEVKREQEEKEEVEYWDSCTAGGRMEMTGVARQMGLFADLETGGGEHDSTALTIVECDLATLADELLQAPTYRVISRFC
jgi:hypothetical protein